MRGIENEHLLHDPYFFTLYDAVSALDMAIASTPGNANPYVRELLAQRNSPAPSGPTGCPRSAPSTRW